MAQRKSKFNGEGMGPQGGKTGKGLEQQGIKKSEAGRRASTTVNRTTGGGNKSGSGRR